MKTKLLTICLLFLTMQAYADDQLDSDGLVVANEDFGDNICHRPLSDLKRYEVVLCQVFRRTIFQTEDRKSGLPYDDNYDFLSGNTILGFTYEKKTNKLFTIIEHYAYIPKEIDGEEIFEKTRRGARTVPLQNSHYPDRVHFVHHLAVFPTESELPKIYNFTKIKSYRKLFPNVCDTSSSEYDKYICEWE